MSTNYGFGLLTTALAGLKHDCDVTVIDPPQRHNLMFKNADLTCTSGLVALDGTPAKRLWELSLGERLNHRQVLSDAERREYVRNGLNLNLVRTSEHVKPYNWADHVNTNQDAALLEATHNGYDERPAGITTATAEPAYENSDAADHIADTRHYRNGLREKCVGAVVGSNHYGDNYLKKWGAFADEAVNRSNGKRAGLSYG